MRLASPAGSGAFPSIRAFTRPRSFAELLLRLAAAPALPEALGDDAAPAAAPRQATVIDGSSTLEDVAFEVCTALAKHDVTAVLTGGSAATIYAPDHYQSRLMRTSCFSFGPEEMPVVADALAEIGFHYVNGMFEHSDTDFTVEFPPGPLAIGIDLITEFATLTRPPQLLYILTATDCVRNRLASFFYWQDYSALETAAAVAFVQSTTLDLNKISDWARQSTAQTELTTNSALCDGFLIDWNNSRWKAIGVNRCSPPSPTDGLPLI